MVGLIKRVAMVSMQGSPRAEPGEADASDVTILALAAEFAIRDVEVDVVTRAIGDPSVSQLFPGVTLHEIRAGDIGPMSEQRLPAVTDEFGERVAELARSTSQRHDIIHAHYWLSGIATLPVAVELGIPLVQSFHTLGVMKNAALGDRPGHEAPAVRLRGETFLAHQADALIAASSAEATALIDDVRAPADRTWIVRPGVDLELFSLRDALAHSLIRKSLQLESDRAIVVIAGPVQPLKGHELAIRALAEMRSSRGWTPVLVIAGEAVAGEESYCARLRSLAAELGVAADVRFVGQLHRDTFAELLSAAAVTIVPSLSEPFGLVALESAASGTPVIGFRSGGLNESVEDGVSGVLLGTREPRNWALEIADMIEDQERRLAMGLLARTHAERFTWGQAAESLLEVYARLY